MSPSASTNREGRAKLLAGLFRSASRSECGNNQENYGSHHGKRMSGKRTERLQEHGPSPR